MGTRIVIPTKNRPGAISRLLGTLLMIQEDGQQYPPIVICDQSDDGKTLQSVRAFEKSFDLVYFGRQQYTELIDNIVKELNIPYEIVNNIFNRGYGGNRNFSLVMGLEDILLSIDDDIVPQSLQMDDPLVEYATLASRVNEKIVGYVSGIPSLFGMPNSKVHFQSYNFVDVMIKCIGKAVGEITAIKGTTIETPNNIGIVLAEGGMEFLTVVGAHPADTAEILIAVPFISYHADVEVSQPKSYEKLIAYANLKPAVLRRKPLTYLCYAAKQQAISAVPFIPTGFRCEDNIHSAMIQHANRGAIMLVGKDVMHQRVDNYEIGEFTPEKIAYIYITSRILRSYVLTAWQFVDDLKYASDTLVEIGQNKKAIERDVEDELRNYQANGKPLLHCHDNIVNALMTELAVASQTFGVWDRIREYVSDPANLPKPAYESIVASSR